MPDYQLLNDQIKKICLAPGQSDDCLAAIDSYYQNSALSSLCREYIGILTSGVAISPVKMSKFRFLARQIHLTDGLQASIERYLSGDETIFDDDSRREVESDDSIMKEMGPSHKKDSREDVGDSGRKLSKSIPDIDFGKIRGFVKGKAQVAGQHLQQASSWLRRIRFSPQLDRRLLFILFKILAIAILIGVAIVGMKNLPQKKFLFLLVLVITGYGIFKTKSLGSLSGMVVFCCIWSLAIVMGVLLSAPLWLMLVFILGGTGYILYTSLF